MAFASAAGSRVAYVAETAFGVTPENPTFKQLRRTGGGLTTRKGTVQSDEIASDRNVRAIPQVSQDVQGSYEIEFSADSFDDMLEAAMMSAWAADVLTVGSTLKSFTVEEMVTAGGVPYFSRYQGVGVNQLQLNMAARQMVRGSLSLMGQKETLGAAVLAGATYGAAPTTPIETGMTVALLSVAGLPMDGVRVKSFSLQIANGFRIRDGVGDLYSAEFGVGQAEVTGTAEFYFPDNSIAQAVLNHGGGAFDFTVGAVSGKKYDFNMPAIQLLDGAKRIGGRNDDVMYSCPWQATGTAAAPSLTITRKLA